MLAAACNHVERRPEATASPDSVVKTATVSPVPAKSKVMVRVAAGPAVVGQMSKLRPGEQLVRRVAADIAAELARNCAPAAPDDRAAFDACRRALLNGSAVRHSLSDATFWGPQNKNLAKGLKETALTSFSPDDLAGLFIPLFMFNGRHLVAWSENEKLWRVEIAASFRNRLQAGQLPERVRQQDGMWRAYEGTNAILLWIEPETARVRFAQFTERGGWAQSAEVDDDSALEVATADRS